MWIDNGGTVGLLRPVEECRNLQPIVTGVTDQLRLHQRLSPQRRRVGESELCQATAGQINTVEIRRL